jgi:hypothetical protein
VRATSSDGSSTARGRFLAHISSASNDHTSEIAAHSLTDSFADRKQSARASRTIGALIGRPEDGALRQRAFGERNGRVALQRMAQHIEAGGHCDARRQRSMKNQTEYQCTQIVGSVCMCVRE